MGRERKSTAPSHRLASSVRQRARWRATIILTRLSPFLSKPSVLPRPEKYTIKPERKEIAAVSIDLTRHDDFQGPRKLEVRGCGVDLCKDLVRAEAAATTPGTTLPTRKKIAG